MQSISYIVEKLRLRNSIFWLFILLLPVLTFLYGTFLWVLSLLLFPDNNGALYTITPAKGAWYFVGILLALGTVSFYLNAIYRHHLKRTYSTFLLQGNMPGSFGAYSQIKKLSWLMCALAAAFIFLLYDNYLVIKNGSLEINEFIGLGRKEYPFNEVKVIKYVQQGNRAGTQNTSARYLILFKDGYVFDEKDNMLQNLDTAIPSFHLSGIPIDTVIAND